MIRIVNSINFSFNINGDVIAFQIAELLNKYNKLKTKHSIYTIKMDKGNYLLYCEDNRIVGCTAYMVENNELTRNYHTSVSFAYRNKGIGSLLIKEVIKEAVTPYLFITVRKDNKQSISLYKKHNFVYVKEEATNLIVMGKRI